MMSTSCSYEKDYETEPRNGYGLIGVLDKDDDIMYIIVEEETELRYTGLSVINRLREDRNAFIGSIHQLQSYFMIKSFFDDKIVFSEYHEDVTKNVDNKNTIKFVDFHNFIMENTDIINIYIYDNKKNLLIVKPEGCDMIELNYKSKSDIKKYFKENSINVDRYGLV